MVYETDWAGSMERQAMMACPAHDQLTAAPFIDMIALSALADLLRQVLKDRAASSNAPLSGASEFSHDQNWREAHVSINVSAAVSQHEGTFGEVSKARTAS